MNVHKDGQHNSDPADGVPRIVVVGGGAAGTLVATHLVRESQQPLDVVLVEREGRVGPGLPYRTRHPLHTLNNYAARMTGVEGDPQHLVTWAREHGHAEIGPDSFVQRGLFGDYLNDLLRSAVSGAEGALRVEHGAAVDLERVGADWQVHLHDHRALVADHVVLALGTPPAREVPGAQELADRWGAGFVHDPWAGDLEERAAGAHRVLLFGTGLTAVDAAVVLHEANPGLELVAVSRRGDLPTAHKEAPGVVPAGVVDEPLARTPAGFAEAVVDPDGPAGELGVDWRDLFDGARPWLNRLWASSSEEERRDFVERVSRRWEVARHRMAPEMARRIDALRVAGTLTVQRLDRLGDESFDLVVSCTGPSPTLTSGWNPLVDALVERGMVREDPLGLGIDLTSDGHPVGRGGDVEPSLHVVGQARRGLEWEVTGIPDLRAQAMALVGRLGAA